MAHIFISYSHKDSKYAHDLAMALEQHGLEAWIDNRIDYGTRWPHVIEERLRECAALIVIMTTHSYKSDWVQNELSYAQRKKKPIFPLLLSGEVWLSVAATQYVDVTKGKQPPQKFFKHILQVLSGEPLKQPTSQQTKELYPKKRYPKKEETGNLDVKSKIIEALEEYKVNYYLSDSDKKDKLVVGKTDVVYVNSLLGPSRRSLILGDRTPEVRFYGIIAKSGLTYGADDELNRLGWSSQYKTHVMTKELFLRKEQLSATADMLIISNKIMRVEPKST